MGEKITNDSPFRKVAQIGSLIFLSIQTVRTETNWLISLPTPAHIETHRQTSEATQAISLDYECDLQLLHM